MAAVFWRLPAPYRNYQSIIITAFGGPDVEAQAIQLGAFAFLEKPVAAAELVDVVKRALAPPPLMPEG